MGVPDWFERSVSRETFDALNEYAGLLSKWTKRINLIAPSTTEQIMERHIWDSAQIYDARPGKWVDMGSGGGLPGIVLAILRKGDGISDPVTLIESDQRKATFLRTCTRALSLNADVIAQRIEDAPPQNANSVSARALTNLTDLLPLAQRHMAEGGTCRFMKGERWQEEMDAALQKWRFSYDVSPSKTKPNAAVLDIRDIERV